MYRLQSQSYWELDNAKTKHLQIYKTGYRIYSILCQSQGINSFLNGIFCLPEVPNLELWHKRIFVIFGNSTKKFRYLGVEGGRGVAIVTKMALSKRGAVGRENNRNKGKYLLIYNTFVRKALAASMNSFRDWPCKHNRVFYENIKTNIFVFKKLFPVNFFATKGILFKANFPRLSNHWICLRKEGYRKEIFNILALTLTLETCCNTYDIRQGLLAMAEEQLIVEIGQAHVKQAHTTQHLGWWRSNL